MSLRSRLRLLDLLLLASILLPALLFGIVAVHDRSQALAAARRNLLATLDALQGQAERVLQFQALALGAVDERLRGLTEAEVLAGAASYQAYLAALRAHAGAEIGIVVFGADGRPLVEAEHAAPRREIDVSDRDYFRRHRDDPSPEQRVGPALASRANGQGFFFVTGRRTTPDGSFGGVIAAGVRLATLQEGWARAMPQRDAAVVLFQRDGTVLARQPALDRDQPARPTARSNLLRAVAEGRGGEVIESTSPYDGTTRLLAWRGIARFPQIAIALGISTDAALAPWRSRLLVYGSFAAAAALALSWLAVLARRRTETLARLNAELEARVETRTAEIRGSEARVRFLAAEVDHRAKNLLAVVQATLRLTPKADPVAYATAVEGRIAALARAQTLLTEDRWRGAELRALLEAELGPFLPQPGGAGPQALLRGPPVRLPARLVQPLAMAIHELATNAVKHGALSTPGGRVEVTWSGAAERLALSWVESGGPPVAAPPARKGFGSRVLEQVIRGQTGGALELRWEPGGLVCSVEVSLAETTALAA